MNGIAKFQIGKNGVTEGVIEALSLVFRTHKNIRISMLKTSGRDRASIESFAKDIVAGLSNSNKQYEFTYKIIGFTIIMRKHPKA